MMNMARRMQVTRLGLSSQKTLSVTTLRTFSNEEQPEAKEPETGDKAIAEEFSEAEKQKYRDAWGLKYDDECLKFEKEWELISEAKDREQMGYLEKELSEGQRKRVDFLADKILSLNVFENRYLAAVVKQRVMQSTGINPLKLNMDWPSIKQDADGTWPPLNPNWFKQQELMSQLGPFMGQMGGGMPAGGAPAPAGGAAEAAPAEDKKPEKSHYDVELSGFAADKKTKLIKEIRGMMSLGLKEAKDLVESAPVWVRKDMKKEEAEEFIEKLKEFGGEFRMV